MEVSLYNRAHSGVNPFVWESIRIGRERGRRADEGELNTDYENTSRSGEILWLELQQQNT